MKSVFLILLFLTPAISEAGYMRADNFSSYSCPPETVRSEDVLIRFMTSESKSDFRTENGMNHLTPADIEIMSDLNPDDLSKCKQFMEESIYGAAFRKPTFYKAGGFYFGVLPIVLPEDSEFLVMAKDWIRVYDAKLNSIGNIAL